MRLLKCRMEVNEPSRKLELLLAHFVIQKSVYSLTIELNVQEMLATKTENAEVLSPRAAVLCQITRLHKKGYDLFK